MPPRIALIPSTTRAGRFADQVLGWATRRASQSKELEVATLDLRDYPLPFFNEPASNRWVPSQNEVARAWQAKLATFDGFLFLVAEYNHSVPAVLKNAFDYAAPEWAHKPAACVGYGAVGAARAIEHLRLICVELQIANVRTSVHIQGADFMATWKEGKPLDSLTHLEPGFADLLTQLAWWANALKAARGPSAP